MIQWNSHLKTYASGSISFSIVSDLKESNRGDYSFWTKRPVKPLFKSLLVNLEKSELGGER